MSIQSEVDRINGNVASTYTVLSDLGADMPATTNTNNLAATATSVKAVLFGKSQSLTEAQKAQARSNIGAISAADVGNIATTEEIVQQVIAALGTPVFGTVDEENNIILSGNLVSGTYTVKYEDAEGVQTNIGTLTASGNDPTPSYTNVIPLSVDVNGQPYMDGKGYRNGYRYSSSSGGDKSGSAYSVTGYIQVAKNDVLYFKNVGMNKNTTDNNSCQMYYFETLKATADGQNSAANLTAYNAAQWDSEGQITQITADAAGYMRFNTGYLGDDSIITINEPIA